MYTKSHRTRLYDLQFVCLKFIAVGVIFQATESILPSPETEPVSNVCNYRGPRLPLKVPTVEGTRSETQTPHEGWTKYSFGRPSIHMSADTDVLSSQCRENLTSHWTAAWCVEGNTVVMMSDSTVTVRSLGIVTQRNGLFMQKVIFSPHIPITVHVV